MRIRMPKNIINYLEEFQTQRYRAMIIHTEPEKGPALSELCQKTCKILKGKYIDLLELFIQEKELNEKIDVFSTNRLRDLLISLSKGQPLIAIDRMDFLLDTWTKNERQDFYRMIDNQWDSFKESMKARVIFCLQTSQEIESLVIKDSEDQSKIFKLTDFNEIK